MDVHAFVQGVCALKVVDLEYGDDLFEVPECLDPVLLFLVGQVHLHLGGHLEGFGRLNMYAVAGQGLLFDLLPSGNIKCLPNAVTQKLVQIVLSELLLVVEHHTRHVGVRGLTGEGGVSGALGYVQDFESLLVGLPKVSKNSDVQVTLGQLEVTLGVQLQKVLV